MKAGRWADTNTIMGSLSPSETLFETFCGANAIPFSRVTVSKVRTPDFQIELLGTRVICEVKQIDPNTEDLSELESIQQGRTTARYVANRLRQKLKHVSGQLKRASGAGIPTVLVVYDNTPFKTYTAHADVVQAMFGRKTVAVSFPQDKALGPRVWGPFFGSDRGVGPRWNTAVSAVAILDGGPAGSLSLRVYHNPYAAVRLDPMLFVSLQARQPVLPDSTEVRSDHE